MITIDQTADGQPLIRGIVLQNVAKAYADAAMADWWSRRFSRLDPRDDSPGDFVDLDWDQDERLWIWATIKKDHWLARIQAGTFNCFKFMVKNESWHNDVLSGGQINELVLWYDADLAKQDSLDA